MKKIAFVLVVVMVFFSACNQKHTGTAEENRPAETGKTVQADTGHARIHFKEYQHDFGNIAEGEIVSYVFEFTNTGSAPLLIKSVSASCGCTVPKYSKKPVPPGSTGELEVVFNSLGKMGAQHKTIAVRANTKPPVSLLVITANVKGKNQRT